jgi:hypothetical protein
MGMFDNVVVLDQILRCPHGHEVSGFQTKSFEDPAMDVYLVDGPNVYLVERGRFESGADGQWQLTDGEAVLQYRYPVRPVVPPREIVFYTSCPACSPVLVRHDRPHVWGDFVEERLLWVEFRATFGPGEARQIERASGARDDLAEELREEGLRVLRDDEPLAIAHHEIRAAREQAPPGRRRRRR